MSILGYFEVNFGYDVAIHSKYIGLPQSPSDNSAQFWCWFLESHLIFFSHVDAKTVVC